MESKDEHTNTNPWRTRLTRTSGQRIALCQTACESLGPGVAGARPNPNRRTSLPLGTIVWCSCSIVGDQVASARISRTIWCLRGIDVLSPLADVTSACAVHPVTSVRTGLRIRSWIQHRGAHAGGPDISPQTGDLRGPRVRVGLLELPKYMVQVLVWTWCGSLSSGKINSCDVNCLHTR